MDPAWRQSLSSVTGHQTISFEHNINFTDIAYPVSNIRLGRGSASTKPFILIRSGAFYLDLSQLNNLPQQPQQVSVIGYNLKGMSIYQKSLMVNASRVKLSSISREVVFLELILEGEVIPISLVR